MTKDIGRSPAAQGRAAAADAVEPVPVSSKASIPNARHYVTLVFAAPSDEALDATVRPLFDAVAFSGDETKPRICAASWRKDAMSVLDAVEIAIENDLFDPYETLDLLRDIAKLDTWEQCLAKFAEWEVEYRDGELADIRAEQVVSA